MTTATLLIVEDEDAIRRYVRSALEAEGFRVYEADGQQRGLLEAATRKPDMLVLDLGLPDGDGVTLIRELRQWSAMPILVLSARSDETDKIAALDAGADDYLIKPFGIGELLARIRAALRRTQAGGPTAGDAQLHFGDIRVDRALRRIWRHEEELHLTPIEYRLLNELLANPDKVLTQRHLLLAVWGPNAVEHNHYLRIYMGHLRQKLEADPARPRHLLTEAGIGYRFVI
ncbi:two-component system response regulator KdpE [Pseudaeromonas sharmana]|uniref:Two-component system response regulator KdpE n=1 Tax=Pseudaeromonas sharmana TaxID=328412 RepID=A0ABV8CPW7_9GAMM